LTEQAQANVVTMAKAHTALTSLKRIGYNNQLQTSFI